MQRVSIYIAFLAFICFSPALAGEVDGRAAACVTQPEEACVVVLITESIETISALDHRAGAYAKIASEYGRAQRGGESRLFLGRALELAKTASDHKLKAKTVRAITERGEDSHGSIILLPVIQKLQSATDRDSASRDLVAMLAKEQAFSKARALSARIGDTIKRASALMSISSAQAQLGDLEGAIETYKDMLEVVDAQEHIDFGLDDLLFLRPKQSPTFVLGDIAAAQVLAGDFEAAFATEKLRHSPNVVRNVMARIAGAQAETGDIDGALETASRIERFSNPNATFSKDPGIQADNRDRALLDIAGSLAEQGQIERALEVVQTIKNEHTYDAAISDIANAQASRGEVDAALQTFGLSKRRKEIWVGDRVALGNALSLMGRLEEAEQYFEGAMAQILAWNDPFDTPRQMTFIALSRFYADQQGALQIFDQILTYGKEAHQGRYYDVAAERVAHSKAQVGLISGATETAMSIDDPRRRARALIGLLGTLLKNQKDKGVK